MFKRTHQPVLPVTHADKRQNRLGWAEPRVHFSFPLSTMSGVTTYVARYLRLTVIPLLLLTITWLGSASSPVHAVASGYPTDPPRNIAWSGEIEAWRDIGAAFNHARQQENSLLGSNLPELVLPEAATWAAWSAGEKALWLINQERTARGLAPLHGLERNVMMVAQTYAEWLLAHNVFAHDADGRSPWERLDDNAAIGACHDFLSIAENLSFTATTSDIPNRFVIEQAIFRMMYVDAESAWGHRHAMLWTPYTENSGAPDREGFLGIGHAHGGFTYGGVYYQNTDILVMNFFDPCATWEEAEDATPTPIPTPTPTATATVISSPSPTVSPTPAHSPTATPIPSPTPLPTPLPAPAETRTVTGQVTAPREPRADAALATVEVVGLAGVKVTSAEGPTTTTGADGWFTLDGLAPGAHTLTFSKPGYSFRPATMTVDLTSGDVVGVAIDGEPGPAGTQLSFAIHLPLIRPN